MTHMNHAHAQTIRGVVVEEELQFTLADLCHACRAEREQLLALVDEGVLQPRGSRPQEWLFSGLALSRARAALRLSRDFELNAAGAALVLELLDEIEALHARLARMGGR
jgi:chaperone modulatory protein CbpM